MTRYNKERTQHFHNPCEGWRSRMGKFRTAKESAMRKYSLADTLTEILAYLREGEQVCGFVIRPTWSFVDICTVDEMERYGGDYPTTGTLIKLNDPITRMPRHLGEMLELRDKVYHALREYVEFDTPIAGLVYGLYTGLVSPRKEIVIYEALEKWCIDNDNGIYLEMMRLTFEEDGSQLLLVGEKSERNGKCETLSRLYTGIKLIIRNMARVYIEFENVE